LRFELRQDGDMAGVCRLTALLLALSLAVAGVPTLAREQDEGAGLCWDPDIEFPVPCDEDEE
jgi:hypothetical protein